MIADIIHSVRLPATCLIGALLASSTAWCQVSPADPVLHYEQPVGAGAIQTPAPVADPASTPVASHQYSGVSTTPESYSWSSGGTRSSYGGSSSCSSVRFFVDGIFWKPRTHGLDYAITTAADQPSLTPGIPVGTLGGARLHAVQHDADAGIRIGAAMSLATDLELEVVWTDFSADEDAFVAAAGVGVPGETIIARGIASGNEVGDVSARHEFDLDMVDLGLTKRLGVGSNVRFGLLGGIRFAQLDQEFQIRYDQNPAVNNNVFVIDESHTMDAVGLRIGMDMDYSPCSWLSVFSSASGSLMAGEFEHTFQRQNATAGSVQQLVRDGYTKAVPVADIAAGLRFRLGRGELRVGYELQNWFGASERIDFPGGLGAQTNVVNGAQQGSLSRRRDVSVHDLMLDGVFVRGQVRF